MPETMDLIYWPFLLVGAYLLGSVPFAQVLARLRGIDLREVGSGNVGAGNLTQQLGLRYGVAAALLDASKGYIPVVVAQQMGLGPGASGLAGLFAVIGHNWSIFMKGRSGRGLATSAGLLLALDPILLIWIGGWSVVGRKFGGGIAGFLGWGLLPIVAAALGRPGTETFLLLLLTFVVMARRVQGNPESELGFRPAMERILYDTDHSPDEKAKTADEPLTP
jgi:glycerol-3-phosphate acyltransferase PlsY